METLDNVFFADSRVVFHSQNCAHCFNEPFVTETHRRWIIFAKLDQKSKLNLTERETTFLFLYFCEFDRCEDDWCPEGNLVKANFLVTCLLSSVYLELTVIS